MSLKTALETLGFGPCYHMAEVLAHPDHADLWLAAWRGEPADWDRVLGGYEATLDWPACTFYGELVERHPDAKVILSVRDPERWYESMRSTVYELSMLVDRSPVARAVFGLISLHVFGGSTEGWDSVKDEIIWQGTFDGRFEDRKYAIKIFERHNAEVRRRVPPDKLLVYEVKEGWGPLCAFLGVEEPDESFPRLNDAARMRRGIRTIRVISLAVPGVLALLVILAVAFSWWRAKR